MSEPTKRSPVLFRASAWLLAVTCTCLFAVPPPSRAQEKHTIAAVEAAWKARQKKFQKVDVKFETRATVYKGGMSALEGPLGGKGGKQQPPEDTTFDTEAILSFDGTKVRYEATEQLWFPNEARFNRQRVVALYDGKYSKQLTTDRTGQLKFPQGNVVRQGAFFLARFAPLSPMFFFCRALEPEAYGIDLTSFTLIDTGGKVRGIACVELRQVHKQATPTSPQSSTHYYLDPARGYLIIRQLNISNSVPRRHLDIDYREDSQLGWVLAGWSLALSLPQGGLYQTEQTKVVSFAANARQPRGHYDLVFPSGALVLDSLAHERWIVRPDGSRRIISRKEYGMTYEELLATPPLVTEETRWQRWRLWVALGFVAGGVAALALFLWRRFRNASALTKSA